ncbi:MAG TPA: 4'-phosphopantetheinyl transferase superfamily protein [Solirubrobacterales bacterium]
MIERILPGTAVAVEAFHDPPDAKLFPEEEAAVGRAVEKRRREFTTARACARAALERLGHPPGPIPSGDRGQPRWPSGVVGSITHCDGYRGCVVARTSDLVTIGIDAEPHEPLPPGLLADIARPEEMGWLRDLSRSEPQIHWDRLLFSAKESVYKAWFPLAERWLGFEDAELAVDPREQSFSARLLVPGPIAAGRQISGFAGRWLVCDGLVVTAIALTAISPEAEAKKP